MTQHKGIHKLGLGTLSVFLSILMIVYLVPLSVYADLAPTIEGNEDTTAPVEQTEQITDESTPPDAMFELTDRREQSVKHFRLSDGSIVAAQYAAPIHEQDENGEWQDIDNTLGDSGNEYATPNAKIKFAKKITGNPNLFTLHDGKYKITMSLDGAIKKTPGTVTNTKTEFGEDTTQLQKMMTLDKLSAKIMYADILDGVDLEYVLESVNIKENIIVKEKKDSYTYTFTLDLNNLTAALQPDGSIHISAPDSGEVKYRMPAPIVYDAAGIFADSSLSAYDLTQTGNHTYTLSVTVNADWMNAEEREFPVTVDPTISADISTVTDLYVSSENPNSNYTSTSVTYVSSNYTTYWKTSQLPTIPASAYIVDAAFSMRTFSAGSGKVGVYGLTYSWDDQLTWNIAAASESQVAAFNNVPLMVDYITLNESATQWYTWNITNIVKAWYSNAQPNYGLSFKPATSSTTTNCTFYSSDYSSGYNTPKLVITYRDMKGVEDYWSFSSHSAGLAGSGSVNLATGNLVFASPTLSTTDGLFGFDVGLIYNSVLTNTSHAPSCAETPMTCSSAGLGRVLNVRETLILATYINADNQEDYYVWSDSDGTEHLFIETETAGTYKDEDGLQLTLVVTDDEATITDANKNVRTFVSSKVSAYNTTEYYVLERVTDRYGNVLRITMDSQNGNVTLISVIPNGTPEENANDYLTISYNSLGSVMRIQNSTAKLFVKFDYAANFESTMLSPTYSGPLAYAYYGHITDAGTDVIDATVHYTYTNVADENSTAIYRLAAAIDEFSQTEIRYTYDTAGRVLTVQEWGQNTPGQMIGFIYGNDYTEIQNSGSDDIYGNDDDMITHYSFDHQGRAANIYSTNLNRNIIYGATAGAYESENENAKNSLKNTIVIGGEATNYIHNGSFENDFVGWTKTDDVTYYDHFPSGARRAKISIYENKQETLSQRLTLPAGEYTLSMECCATYCVGVTATMRVKSLTSGSTQNEAKALTVNCTGEFDEFISSPALTFTSNGGAYEISIEATGTDGALYIDNIMLEENIGASAYGMLEFGSFENTFASSGSTTATYTPTTYWNNITSGYAELTQSDNSLFGQSLSIIGSMDMDKWAYQRVNVVSDNAYSMTQNYQSSYPDVYKSRTFAISGFAKGTQQVPNPDTTFCLVVRIQYHDGPMQNEVFEFNKDLTDWQYLLGSFSTKDGYAIDYIQIECKYSYQPGVAYFDDINLFEVKDSSAASYAYYDNGLPKYMVTPSYSEYYAYYDNNDLKETVTSDGYALDYFYNGNKLESVRTSTYKFTGVSDEEQANYTIFNYGEKDSAYFKDIVKTNISEVKYSINNYGLPTVAESYGIDENGVASSKLKSEITYYESLGCPIFGYVKSETNTAGQTTTYVYDQNKGLLTYTQNGASGLYYTYDALGRTTNVTPILYMGASNALPQEDVENLTYTYDTYGRVSTIATDSTTYTFTYDEFGNTQNIKAGSSTLATYTYADSNGKLQSMTYGNGTIAQYTYDQLDRVVEMCYTNSSGTILDKYTYTYRADGRLHTVESTASKRGYEYSYDAKGQLTGYQEYDTETKARLLAIGQVFDQDGKLTGAQYGVGYKQGSNTLVGYLDYTFTYNSLDELKSVKLSLENADINQAYDYDELHRLSSITTSYGTTFNHTAGYEYRNRSTTYTTGQVSKYTSTVNGTSTEYTYTYDQYGNITSITDSAGKVTKYYYDDLQQLIREDNPYFSETYVYTYNNAGNRTKKETYTYTTGSLSGTTSSKTQTLSYYSATGWYDMLWMCNDGSGGSAIGYDAIGNPTTYHTDAASYTFTWQNGSQLATATKNGTTNIYKYNDSGIRTSKKVDNVEHIYTLNGSQIVSETWGNNTLIYLYEETGSPIGMQYRTSSMEEGEFVNFFFEKNLFGDIVAIYNEAGNKIGSYKYDAWGICTTSVQSTASTFEQNIVRDYNPFRYRGYYYDTETEFYYLQSRYYDPVTGRFLNADGYINANGDLIGFNMYAYCSNNPVMYIDSTGQMWQLVPALHPRNQANIFKGNMDGISGGYIQPRFTTAYSESSAYSTWTISSITAYFDGMLGGYFTESLTHGILNFDYYNVLGAVTVTDDMATTNSHCFVEGTLVATENGLVPIEDILPGDLVWATNPETGETALKQVVQLFRNETKEWIHITVNGETIICTPKHPFYSPVKGWINAIDLRTGDILVTVNGEYVVLEQVQHELLETPVTVYNFEVEGFHTYHVGQTNILVHNDCKPKSPSKVSNNYIDSNNIDAHAFKNKAAKIPKNLISKYDIYKDTANKGKLWVGDKAGKIWKETKYFFEDLTTSWRK